MAKLILRFEAAVLKEIPLQKASLSIGRLLGNDIVIDNLAVSGYHARLSLDQDHYVLEDMNSLNGTFLNNQRVRRIAFRLCASDRSRHRRSARPGRVGLQSGSYGP